MCLIFIMMIRRDGGTLCFTFNHKVLACFLLCHYNESFDRMFILNLQILKHSIVPLAKNCMSFSG